MKGGVRGGRGLIERPLTLTPPIWKHYQRSPLVQGGLEVPCDVMVTMNVFNYLLLTRYEKLLDEFYIEPKNKKIVGTFLSVPSEKGKQIEAKLRQQKEKQ